MNPRAVACVAAAVSLWSVPAPAEQAPQSVDRLRVEKHTADADRQPVQVRTWLSRTAVWIGDPIDFVVELTCAPNVDVLADDLAREKLKLDGLDVVSTDVERVVSPDGGITHRVRYRLTTSRVGAPTLTIGGMTVRYYIGRPGQQPEDSKPAGEVRVPGATVARRSTLPDELPTLETRDAGALSEVPGMLRLAYPVGLGLIIVAGAPLAVWTVAVIRRSRARTRRPSARVVRSHTRAAIDELRAIDTTTDSSRREAYGRLDAAVREHLAQTRGIPARALCASEIAQRLQSAGDGAAADAAGELLAECERARYGPLDRVPPPDRFTAALTRAEEILGAPRS